MVMSERLSLINERIFTSLVRIFDVHYVITSWAPHLQSLGRATIERACSGLRLRTFELDADPSPLLALYESANAYIMIHRLLQ